MNNKEILTELKDIKSNQEYMIRLLDENRNAINNLNHRGRLSHYMTNDAFVKMLQEHRYGREGDI